ncbi:MAG: hypothetical protein JST60_05685 [Chloroflexi bacterium SZAS-1]|jgi:hypothetical protein|nr:hypothetical protein [Chloroflexi bacterium SZAS-1]HNP85467.1 hypothetical protein [Kouleothrix sp.]
MLMTIVGILAVCVLIGTVFLIYSVRHTQLPSNVLTAVFAFTAVSWLAFIIAAIGATVILFALPRI